MDIDQLALKHLTRHKNDKSGRYLAKMTRTYGKKATEAALHRMRNVAKLMELKVVEDTRQPVRLPNKLPRSNPRNGAKTRHIKVFNPEMQRIRRHNLTFSVIDEFQKENTYLSHQLYYNRMLKK